jgi:hypothetical protein
VNFLKQCYIELDNLKYSEENIAELFSIRNRIIEFLKLKNPNRKKNDALHFVLLTKEREFEDLKDPELKDDLEEYFHEARSGLMYDLTLYCREYWNSVDDPV